MLQSPNERLFILDKRGQIYFSDRTDLSLSAAVTLRLLKNHCKYFCPLLLVCRIVGKIPLRFGAAVRLPALEWRGYHDSHNDCAPRRIATP
jgi:hypothetical protein